MPRVFISHASGDRDFVEREVVAPLAAAGIDVWYCRESIRTAEDWQRSILEGLRACEWFLVVLSPRSADSEWVRDEVHWAVEHRPGKVVPALMEPCDPRELHIRLPRIQVLDLAGDKQEAVGKLI